MLCVGTNENILKMIYISSFLSLIVFICFCAAQEFEGAAKPQGKTLSLPFLTLFSSLVNKLLINSNK